MVKPIWTLATLVAGYRDASPDFEILPGLATMFMLDALLSSGFAAFSVYAGICLWRQRPGAVQFAKFYLLCSLGYFPVAAFLPFMLGLPAELSQAVLSGVAKDAVRAAISVAIWYSYLNQSKRVKATYKS